MIYGRKGTLLFSVKQSSQYDLRTTRTYRVGGSGFRMVKIRKFITHRKSPCYSWQCWFVMGKLLSSSSQMALQSNADLRLFNGLFPVISIDLTVSRPHLRFPNCWLSPGRGRQPHTQPPNWRTGSPYLYPLETEWPSYTPRHRVPILVAFYDMHGLRVTIFCIRGIHSNVYQNFNVHVLKSLSTRKYISWLVRMFHVFILCLG
jgi:hypothetical protein